MCGPFGVLSFCLTKISFFLNPLRPIRIYIPIKSFKYRNLNEKEFNLLSIITLNSLRKPFLLAQVGGAHFPF